MNRKIPFHDLSSLLAESCAITTAEAEDFVRSFFDLVTATLVEGEDVTVKGLGTFRRTSSQENPVEFVPDRVLADGINAPFAMFEPEVLAPTVTDELLAAQDTAAEPTTEPEPAPAPAPEPVKEPDVTPAPEAVKEPDATPAPEAVKEPEAAPEAVEEPEAVPDAVMEPEATPEPEVAPAPVIEPEAEAAPESEPAESEPAEPEPAEHKPAEPAPVVEPEAETIAETTPAHTDSSDTSVTSATSETSPTSLTSATSTTSAINPVPTATPASEEDEDEYLPAPERQGMSWGWGFVIGLLVGMAVGACAVYFTIDYIFPSQSVSIESVDETIEADVLADASAALADTPVLPADSIAPTDSVAVPAAAADTIAAAAVTTPAPEAPAKAEETAAPAPAPKAAPVKDTVKAGYLLPTMARKHYGDKNFWVYIYEENKAVISNPNRIRPGLTVVIPPAEKYGIDARNSASVSRAKDKAAEILRKFPN